MTRMKVWCLAALVGGVWAVSLAAGQTAAGTFEADDADGRQGLVPGVDAPWCLTQERYVESLEGQGLATACSGAGPCDYPFDRDASIPTPNTAMKTVRLSIHVFRNNNGSDPAATLEDVAAAVTRLNADYAPWRFQFVYEARFVNSTKYRTLDSSEVWFMKKDYADSPATKLNVYVVNTGGNNWGTFPWMTTALDKQGGIVMNEFAFAPPSNVLTHEVGHCLGLWHTFHGVTEVDQCGDCYEPVGRSPEEGDLTGDRCSDTNPTMNHYYCGDPAGVDPCNGLPWLSTPYRNFMGYSIVTCVGPNEFTPQQAGRMHCWTDAVLGGWLQVPMPPATLGSPSLAKIGGGNVRIDWADNSADEDGFRVQRETKSGGSWINSQVIATVGADVTTTNDAPGSGTFRYRVQAFNGVGDSAWSSWTQIKN